MATTTAVCGQTASSLSQLRGRSLEDHRRPPQQSNRLCRGDALFAKQRLVRLSSSSFHSNLLYRATTKSINRKVARGATIRSGMNEAEDLVRTRKVRPISHEDVYKALTAEGDGNAYKLLDVRPEWEYAKAHSSSSLHVPLFVEHDGKDIGTLIAKGFALGYGGLWMGIRHTKVNEQFLNEVKRQAPKEQRLLVSCGDGLRSLLAAEVLYNAGYRNLAWLEGGFRFVENKDLPEMVGDSKIKYASAGGIAGVLLTTVDKFQSS